MSGRVIVTEEAGRSGLPAPWDGRTLLRLGERWALGADELQWIVLQARRHRGSLKWQAIAFVNSHSAVLRRVLREAGAELSHEGEAALNALNPTFREWRDQMQRRRCGDGG
jgi:hypothetical protein